VGEADLGEPASHDLIDVVVRARGVLAQRERDVLLHAHRAEQCAILEENPEGVSAHRQQSFLLEIDDGLPFNANIAGVGLQEADDVADAH
jgi:hypothetical protein